MANAGAQTAQDWINAMMYGRGAYPGQMGGYGQSGMASLFGGLAMAGPGMFGGGGTSQGLASSIMLPALIANMFASPGTPGLGMATSNLMGRSMMGLAAAGAFGNVQGGGGTMPGGFGLGPSALGGITGTMESLTGTGPRDLGMGDVSKITQMAGQGGFFNSVTQVRDVRARLKEMVNTVKSLSQELSMTIDEVSSGMNAMRGMGFNTASSAGTALRQVMRQSAAAGMDPAQMMTYSAQQGELMRQVAHIPQALATTAARNTLGFIGAGVRGGMVSEESLMNAYGASGQEGAVMMANRVQELGLRAMNRAPMQFSMAAVMDSKTGQIDLNKMNQLITGQMGASEIQRNANQYVSSLGPGGYAKWLGQMPQMRGQFEAAGASFAPAALAATLMSQHGYDMNPSDPRNVAAFSRIISRQTGTQVDAMEARAMMEQYRNMGNTAEAVQIAGRRQQDQEVMAAQTTERYARRDPIYQLQQIQRERLATTTSFIERQATETAARLERVTSGASGQGFDVMVGADYWRSQRVSGGGMSGAGETQEAAGWFSGSATDIEGRAGLADYDTMIGKEKSWIRRAGLRIRQDAAASGVRQVEAQRFYNTESFMGRRSSYEMSPEEVQRSLGRGGRQEFVRGAMEDLRRTGEDRESMLNAFNAASTQQRATLISLYGDKAATAIGFMESVAAGSETQARLATSTLTGGGGFRNQDSREQARRWRAGAQSAVGTRDRLRRRGVDVGYGELEYAAGTSIGERFRRDRLPEQAASNEAVKAFGGQEAAKVGAAFIAENLDFAAQIDKAMQTGVTGTTIGEIARKGGIDVKGIDEAALATAVSETGAQGFHNTLKYTEQVLGAEGVKMMREAGWSSDTRMERIQAALKGGNLGRGARTFGEAMSSVGEMLRTGKDPREALGKTAEALVGLIKGGGLEEATRAGMVEDPGEAKALRKAMRSGGGVTLAEYEAQFGQQSFADIAARTEISVEKLQGLDRNKVDKEVSEKLTMTWAKQAVTPGQSATETAAGRGAGADLASQFAGILQPFAEGGTLRVTVTNMPGANGDVQEPAGGSGGGQPVGNTGYRWGGS